MSKNIRPLGNRILIQRSQVKVSKGGILLPDSAQEKPKQGRVLAIGPGKTNADGTLQAMHVKEGDVVLFSTYSGMEVKTDDPLEECLILSEDDVLGILV